MTITPPRPGDPRPEWPLPPTVTLTLTEEASGAVRVEAWSVGIDGSRCSQVWRADAQLAAAYPELWDLGLRSLVEAVRQEMRQAGIGDWGQENAAQLNPPPPPAP